MTLGDTRRPYTVLVSMWHTTGKLAAVDIADIDHTAVGTANSVADTAADTVDIADIAAVRSRAAAAEALADCPASS